jgi:hypothetical protein
VNFPADDLPENPEAVQEVTSPVNDLASGLQVDIGPAIPTDPFWWDIFVLVLLTVLSALLLLISVSGTVLIAKRWVYPHLSALETGSVPLVLISAEAAWYVLVLACMYLLVTRVQHCSHFLAAIRWHWPSKSPVYVFAGICLAVALQGLAHLLPIPKNLPIDNMFRTPAEAWVLSIFSITLAPLMEELYFRGFLYPVLARYLEMASAFLLEHCVGMEDTVDPSRNTAMSAAILLTAAPFALLHGAQLGFAWGPVLVIFLVGVVLTTVRARTNSVAAGVLIHMAYNGTISVAMFFATNGFRHLEKLNQ